MTNHLALYACVISPGWTGADVLVFIVFGLLAVTRPVYLYYLRATQPGGRRVRAWLQPVQLGTFYATIVFSAAEYLHFGGPLLWWPLMAGVLVLIAATQALKIWAIMKLGPYWSAHVEIHNHHPLIKTGPYAWMRHPSYLNGIVEGLCIPLISSSWFTLVFASLAVAVVFSFRIATEEKAMSNATETSNAKSLGEEYKDYCRSIGRFGNKYSILFWLIPVTCVPAVWWLLVDLCKRYHFHYLFGSVTEHSVQDQQGLPWIQLHQLLYEGICTIGVSATILTAGMAIAAPLYQSVWQGTSDSLFELHQRIRAMLRDINQTFTNNEKTRLLKHCCKLEDALDKLRRRVRPARIRFQCTLLSSAGLLLLTIVLIAVPREEVIYVGAAIITCLSVAVGLMVIHLIFEITLVGPAEIRVEIQSDVAHMSKIGA